MNLNNKKVVVTGAAGFIGSNLTDKLLQLGAEVIGIDNFFNGKIENLDEALESKNFNFIKGDIRDLNFLLSVFKDVDIVFHQAAFTSVPLSVEMPASCNDVNINGVLNVLNAARIRDTEKVIFASSSSIYGDTPTLPKSEDMKTQPISPYGVSKLACEGYMQVYYHLYGLKTTSLRYFNVFGPRQKDSPYSGVIAIWLGKIIKNEDLIIFGNGEQSRDFTYINDVVKANILVTEHDVAGKTLNIAAGSPINLTDLAKLMLKITNKSNLRIKYDDPRPGDILHSYADISLAQKLLKYQPEYSQEQGLRDYFNWFSNKYKVELNIN